MLDEIDNLPTHALALHAAVVLVPLAAFLGVLFAVPRTRGWARLPLLLAALASVAAVYVAIKSGEHLQRALQLQGPTQDLVERHAELADVLLYGIIGYAGIAAAAFAVTRRSTRNTPVTTVVAVLVVLGALGVAYQTYRVGELGARAVWNPTGQVDYSSDG